MNQNMPMTSLSSLLLSSQHESLATPSASIPSSNPSRNPSRSADMEAVLEHLNSMGYAPPASLVLERTPASGYCSSGEGPQEEAVTSQPSEMEADAPPSPDDDENSTGALLHMSTVYHYVPPDSILHHTTASTSTLSHSKVPD
jgi:hypothetical protein